MKWKQLIFFVVLPAPKSKAINIKSFKLIAAWCMRMIHTNIDSNTS